MSTTSRSLRDWRDLFTRMCRSSITAGIHSVTFQPTSGSTNEDRFIVEEWLIEGRTWKFFVVFDGHGGEYTAEYGAANLAERIGGKNRVMCSQNVKIGLEKLISRINKLLFWRIYYLDREIGISVQNLCPDPSLLDEEARALVDANIVFLRAFSGTTLAVALLDEEQDNLWVAGLGDSTVALAFKDEDGLGEAEKDTIMKDDRLLGTILPTRGLCDHALKFQSIFSTKLFFKLPTENKTKRYLDGAQDCNKTSPYVLNAADTRFVDLAPLRHRKPTLVLFTDGADIIVGGETTVDKDPEDQNRSDPAVVVGKLLRSRVDDSYAQEMLEHGVKVNWMGANGNRVTESLGNLIAGTSMETFAKFLGPAEHGEWDDNLYFNDTTILVYGLTSYL
ncbi:hypothetical protein ARMGADRAFT_1082741 [Armillaria gallica]|uniref:PPM-type phosphatase domain-containing protein n=1 Tax=Armillaria gallica TaxID=47427 RepID=A0A2H3D5H2_ARMGA|nr:hypothetical protein ARMGADRAFT_1082741 [Armillaria gallica]